MLEGLNLEPASSTLARSTKKSFSKNRNQGLLYAQELAEDPIESQPDEIDTISRHAIRSGIEKKMNDEDTLIAIAKREIQKEEEDDEVEEEEDQEVEEDEDEDDLLTVPKRAPRPKRAVIKGTNESDLDLLKPNEDMESDPELEDTHAVLNEMKKGNATLKRSRGARSTVEQKGKEDERGEEEEQGESEEKEYQSSPEMTVRKRLRGSK